MPGLPGQAGYIPYAQRPNMLFIFVTARFKYNIVLASRLAFSTTHKTRRYKYKQHVETLSIRYMLRLRKTAANPLIIENRIN